MNIGIVYNSFAQKTPLPEEIEMRETGLSVGKRLSGLGYRVWYFDVDSPESIEQLCASKIDVAFDACERVHDDSRGEAYVAALLEYLGIPHTRTTSWLISLGISKERVKSILTFHKVMTPHYQVFRRGDEGLDPAMKYPLFVKGLSSENSIGIDRHSLVQNQRQLKAKVNQVITQLHQPALVEEFIDGREFTVAILPGLKNKVLPISEIIFRDLPPERRFLDYNAKWFTDSESFQKTIPVCPACVTDEERRHLIDTALHCFQVLGLNSYTRIDMRYRDHTAYVLDVNQNPSISEEGSGYVRTCRSIGLDYAAMIQVLLENAIARKCENLPDRARSSGCSDQSQDTADLFQLESARI